MLPSAQLPSPSTLRRQAQPYDDPTGGLDTDFERAVRAGILPEDWHYYQYQAKRKLSLKQAQHLAVKRSLLAALKQWHAEKRHVDYKVYKEELFACARQLSLRLLKKDVFWTPSHKLYHQLCRFPDALKEQRAVLLHKNYDNQHADKLNSTELACPETGEIVPIHKAIIEKYYLNPGQPNKLNFAQA